MWYYNQEIGFVQNKGLITENGLAAHAYTDAEKDALFASGQAQAHDAAGRIYCMEPEPLPEPESPTLEAVQAAKLAEILTGANRAYQTVTSRYSVPEQQSWAIQKAQAEALLADPEAEAPEVRALAANRGIPVMEFAGRILNNAALASAASLAIILQQQGYEDKLALAQTVEAVTAITIAYKLPVEVI